MIQHPGTAKGMVTQAASNTHSTGLCEVSNQQTCQEVVVLHFERPGSTVTTQRRSSYGQDRLPWMDLADCGGEHWWTALVDRNGGHGIGARHW